MSQPALHPQYSPEHQFGRHAEIAPVIDISTGQRLPNPDLYHPDDIQPTIYDWKTEDVVTSKHIGTFPSSEHSDVDETLIPRDGFVQRAVGEFAAGIYKRIGSAKKGLGLDVVPKPRDEWKPGTNQLDHLPEGLIKRKW
jgi:hypothetical protein